MVNPSSAFFKSISKLGLKLAVDPVFGVVDVLGFECWAVFVVLLDSLIGEVVSAQAARK